MSRRSLTFVSSRATNRWWWTRSKNFSRSRSTDAATASTHGWLTGWLRAVILTERLTILFPLTATAVLAATYTQRP